MFHLIANTSHIKPKDINTVLSVFEFAGKECALHPTFHKGHAKQLAEELSSTDKECSLVVMGGDGTLHEVLNGIKDFEHCCLGLIPAGTGNDFAAAAKIPNDIKYAAQVIAYKQPRPIDYIQLADGLRSINAVGMGIDVDVLKRTYKKNTGKKITYLTSLIYCLSHFKSYNYAVEFDGGEEKHYGLIAALGNGKQIGGGIKLFPDAVLDDGYMDLLMVDYLSGFKTVMAFLKLMTGRINKIKEVTAVKVKKARFTVEVPCSIQAEGEIYDRIEIDAHIVEKGLKFYLPEV
ncbi:MAG: YegS/Rv2252/BmrU family lipid kinase [Clostridia bacterium]|nr:YegS/Rv2252/BmrU family lipid kinase [Clostridia bacterium]